MTSEKQLAATHRNAPLSSGEKTAAERKTPGRNARRGERTGQIDVANLSQQQFADLVADPGWFIRITKCEQRVRAARRKNVQQLLDLQILKDTVLTARTAAEAKGEFAPSAQTSSGQLADNTDLLIPGTSIQREAPPKNGFVFSNDLATRDGQALRSGTSSPRASSGVTSPSKNGFEFSNDQIARRPLPSKKAKVIPIDSYKPPNAPPAA